MWQSRFCHKREQCCGLISYVLLRCWFDTFSTNDLQAHVCRTAVNGVQAKCRKAAAKSLHCLEQMAVQAANSEFVGATVQGEGELAAVVTHHTVDGACPYHRTPVDLPEGLVA